MDLHHLEVFCQVYDQRSFSKAARRLGLSQPTVSTHVKGLEEELGIPLFNRLGREVEPTEAGEFLIRRARHLLKLRHDLLERLQGFQERLEGELILGASTIPGEYLLPPILVRFRATHPKVRVAVQIHDSGAVVGDVRSGAIHLGVVGARLEHPELEYREVARDRLVLVAPPEDRWAHHRRVRLEDLTREPLLLREEGSGTRLRFERLLAARGLALDDFRVAAELGSTAAVKESVKAGLGLSFVSDLAVESERRAGLLEVVSLADLAPVERSFFAVLHRRRALSTFAEAFLDQLPKSPPPAGEEAD